MNKRLLIFLLFQAICNCPGLTVRAQTETSRPNVIIIFMDDMGYGDIGSFGASGYATPHIDQLAAEGISFTHFYAAQPICSASRAALLTGCYPNRVGIPMALAPNKGIGLAAEEETIAEVLKKKDYATAIVGKWHLGNEPPFLPTLQGFDEFYGLPYSNDMWRIDFDGQPAPPGSAKQKYPPLALLETKAGKKEVDTVMIIDDMEDQSKLTSLYTERAIDFIRVQKDSPFFLYLAHSMVHVPLGVSSRFRGKSEQGTFGDVMMEVDWSTGQIMETLRDLGIDKNTLIIFTSDNGPSLNFGDHAGSAGGLREGKATSWEGGMRVPCIMRWPGVIPRGTVSGKLASTLDILATLASITGTPMPERKTDGVNIFPLMKGEENANPRDHLFYYFHQNDLEAVRQGPWKLVFPHNYRSYEDVPPGSGGVKGAYNKGQTALALYNLRRDPGERYDISESHPDIVRQLQELAANARRDLGDALTGTEGTGRRPAGSIGKK